MIKGVKYIVLLILLSTFTKQVSAESISPSDTIWVVVPDSMQCVSIEDIKEWPQYVKIGKKNIKNPVYVVAEDVVGKDKATAIVLTLLTGPLGGHRLYLGTTPIVPVVYACTLGGGIGVLPFIDLVVICFSKDISRFENNDKIFMWAK
ncbi:MAG: TM2 domain-containing protein [Bacteroidia bacterium]|nr:TM2 domain-containing protein [Bacteroidia bacterium]